MVNHLQRILTLTCSPLHQDIRFTLKHKYKYESKVTEEKHFEKVIPFLILKTVKS